jgi:DNA polymerase III epsilon subunit-like protein
VTYLLHIDVETTGFDPAVASLLSLAAVLVDQAQPEKVIGHWYRRLTYQLKHSDEDTLAWWAQQAPDVRKEAFGLTNVSTKDLLFHHDARRAFTAWLASFELGEPVVPTADPAAFDRKWLDWMLGSRPVDLIHYRSLCLRSWAFGRDGGDFNQQRSDRAYPRPEYPHHPLSDALSQAEFYAGKPLVNAPAIKWWSKS